MGKNGAGQNLKGGVGFDFGGNGAGLPTARIGPLGFAYAKPWAEIRAHFEALARTHPKFQHMLDIVDSVIAAEMDDRLAATTGMHDLIVARTPIREAPLDVIQVFAPGSIANPRTGEVIIQHLATDGQNERLARPVSEAVRLFWRFVIEKYGIHPPARDGEPRGKGGVTR